MNPRTTWIWAAVAATLFCIIYAYQKLAPPKDIVRRILPMIISSSVQTVQVRPHGELEIRAVRTNGHWVLTDPIKYPARSEGITQLLGVMERLVPATYISSRELRERPQSEEEYGFSSPQGSIVITQPGVRVHVLVGRRTAPGDQVFVQVVGTEGVYVVDAALLEHVPVHVNQWRDTAFAELGDLVYDRVTVTNAGRFFELQRDTPEAPWRMVRPIPARADPERVGQALESLQQMRVRRFLPERSDTDLESLGLAPPELVIGLWRGSNAASILQFGRSPTNEAQEVYARASGRDTLATVSAELVQAWRASASEFRDRHVAKITEAIGRVEVKADDTFALVRTNEVWLVWPEGFPADEGLLRNVLQGLETIEVEQFVKDVVTEPDLALYGFAPPSRQYSLYSPTPAVSAISTQAPLVEIHFGTNDGKQLLVRRTDENSVYAVGAGVTNLLPTRSWQMRERAIFKFDIQEVEAVSLQESGRQRRIVRKGAHDWSLAPGSSGVINDLAIEETVKGLGTLSASAWVARKPVNPGDYGFGPESLEVTVELKGKPKATVRLGGVSPSQFPYAATALDGELWVFEFPWALHRDVISYLSVPANGTQ